MQHARSSLLFAWDWTFISFLLYEKDRGGVEEGIKEKKI
jgi:hypothetical protein